MVIQVTINMANRMTKETTTSRLNRTIPPRYYQEYPNQPNLAGDNHQTQRQEVNNPTMQNNIPTTQQYIELQEQLRRLLKKYNQQLSEQQ